MIFCNFFIYYYYLFFIKLIFLGLNINTFFLNLFLLKKLIILNVFKNLIFIYFKKIYFANYFLSFFYINYLYILIYFCFFKFFIYNFLIYFIKNYISKIAKNTYLFFFQLLFVYPYYKFSDYNFLYQYWYRFARNQKNTYLALRFRLVYLNKKKIENEIFNIENLKKDDIQEYFVLKRKNFLDSYLKPVKIRKFIPLIKFRREYFSVKRQRMTLKGLLFFYFKDYENRINNKEQQQKTLRIYEGLYGTLMFKELLKKEDQKQAKFIKMKLHRE